MHSTIQIKNLPENCEIGATIQYGALTATNSNTAFKVFTVWVYRACIYYKFIVVCVWNKLIERDNTRGGFYRTYAFQHSVGCVQGCPTGLTDLSMCMCVYASNVILRHYSDAPVNFWEKNQVCVCGKTRAFSDVSLLLLYN